MYSVCQKKRGVSITELIVAVALLSIITAVVGHFVAYMNHAIETHELHRLMRWELDNAREQIGSWQPDEITVERISALPFTAAVREKLQNPAWLSEIQVANIQGLDRPPAFLSVRIAITADYREQSIRPIELFFWVAAKSEETKITESPSS